MLSQVAEVIEPARLQVGVGRRDFGNGGLRQYFLGDVLDRGIGDLVNEADMAVFAGGNARDELPPCDFRIDDGLAPARP